MVHERGQFNKQANSIARMAFGKAAFKKKLQQKRDAKVHEKAKMLREYAKLCQREGIVSERVHIGPREVDQEAEVAKSKERISKHKKGPAPVSSLIKTYEQVTKKRSEEKLESAASTSAKETERLDHIRKRELDNKKRRQMTSKGQPILGNQIKSILDKLSR